LSYPAVNITSGQRGVITVAHLTGYRNESVYQPQCCNPQDYIGNPSWITREGVGEDMMFIPTDQSISPVILHEENGERYHLMGPLLGKL
jgi:hypothetical protein